LQKILMNVKETCTYLNLCESKVRKMANNPKCDFVVRSGAKILFHKELLDKYIERCAKYHIPI